MARHEARAIGWLLLLLLLLVAAAGVACESSEQQPHRALVPLWREYEQLPGHRAMAIAGRPERTWVAGMSANLPTPAEAEKEALAECGRRRLDRRLRVPCLLYAVDDEIVFAD